MKKLKIVFHESAIEDLGEIWLHTFQTSSIEQADRYHFLSYREIGFLARKPKSGRDFSYVLKSYTTSKVKSHLIFCKYSSFEIEIIRILHENLDITNRLND